MFFPAYHWRSPDISKVSIVCNFLGLLDILNQKVRRVLTIHATKWLMYVNTVFVLFVFCQYKSWADVKIR